MRMRMRNLDPPNRPIVSLSSPAIGKDLKVFDVENCSFKAVISQRICVQEL